MRVKGEYFDIKCVFSTQPTMITIPIEDYNRLRKLEIKEQIKKLRKEYDTL